MFRRWCYISNERMIFLQGAVASTASCLQLHKRAERVAAALMGRLNTGDHVALVYPPGEQFLLLQALLSVQECYDILRPNWRLCSGAKNQLNFLCFTYRNRPDFHFLWLPVCWLCAGDCQTAPPTEPGDHSTNCQNDCWGKSGESPS